jgi:hypothetical protein
MYALHLWIRALDYTEEPKVECLDNDVNDATFVRVTVTIEGHDAVKEFVACGKYPLASSFDFRDVAISTIAMSKVETPLLVFLWNQFRRRMQAVSRRRWKGTPRGTPEQWSS